MGINVQKYNLRLVKESGSRYELEDRIIKHPRQAHKIFTRVADLHRRTEEVLVMLTLDSQNSLIGVFEVAIGSLSRSIVNPREVLKRALLSNAASIILGHNHPSGSAEPSEDDINVTNKIMESSDLMGINFFDHIIIAGEDEYISLKSDGYI